MIKELLYMKIHVEKGGYGYNWTNIFVDSYEGYKPQMSDYHMHEYYEISIISQGRVSVLLNDSVEKSENSKLVLLRPFTPHYIYCDSDILYKRKNVIFSHDFIANYFPEWLKLIQVFTKNGSVIKLDKTSLEKLLNVADMIQKETDFFRQRLLLFYLLSCINECMIKYGDFSKVPGYIMSALSYIGTHYHEKIIAEELAKMYSISRTTFMVSFKKHVGNTFNEYLNQCRINNAIPLLQSGENEEVVAAKCGLNDASNLIRCFKKCIGTTPKQYIIYYNSQRKNKL